jgi:hypothetical protein
VIVEGFAHLLFSVRSGEQSSDEDNLRLLSCLALEVATDKIVEELVVATEFDIGFHGDRIVSLEDGVLKFGQANGDALFVAFGEIIPLKHAGDVDLSVKSKKVGAREFGEPLSVSADFSFFGIDNFKNLVGVGFGVLFDGLRFKGRASFGATRGVAHTSGVVTHDDDGKVACLLELADLR